MWPYRDWVIQALNEDMPFDQFTIEQLAGDLLPNPSREQLIATGFHRNTLINEEGGTDAEQFRVEAVVDRVNTTGIVWLGLTIGCAQCHTHKFDPISQHEYYRLFAFFNNCEDANSRPPMLNVTTPAQQKKLDELDTQIGAGKQSQLPSTTGNTESKDGDPAEWPAKSSADSDKRAHRISGRFSSISKKKRKQYVATIPQTMILRERTTPRETNVLIRGDFLRKGERVFPDTPAMLPKLPASAAPRTRLDLARWLVNRENPLTARVTVNRVWARYFGRGLVETENDFGLQGTPPTHPELLDWLADEFMDQGWSLKQLHRLILNSATYRQSSQLRPDLAEVDPLNKLLGRQARLRVEAEIVRDLGLSVSGLLSRQNWRAERASASTRGRVRIHAGPPPVADQHRFGTLSSGHVHILHAERPYPMLTTFDTPVFNVTCTFRQRSNTPLQSLTMANDETMIEIALALGQRILRETGTARQRIRFAFQLCFARPADSFEVERLAKYIDQQRQAIRNRRNRRYRHNQHCPVGHNIRTRSYIHDRGSTRNRPDIVVPRYSHHGRTACPNRPTRRRHYLSLRIWNHH